jgi:hypothetical protein
MELPYKWLNYLIVADIAVLHPAQMETALACQKYIHI